MILYQTLDQPKILLYLFLFGFLCGFIFDIKNILNLFLLKNNLFLCNLFNFFNIFLVFFIYFYLNLKINFGEFRIFSIITYGLSFTIQRFLSRNFLAKPCAKCYNKVKGKINERSKKT